jgi:cyclophilin family peptidyl-prolyl cis-trans isomerase
MTTVLLQTTMGDVRIGLLEETMPVTAGNFRNLVEKRFYDGTIFHRVITGFMVQGGDPEGNRIELWEPPKVYRAPERAMRME